MKTETLETRYAGDLGLLAYYKRKLLIPGWAGELDNVESCYVAAKLTEDKPLRSWWRRTGNFKRLSKKITPGIAQRMAAELATTPLAPLGGAFNKRDEVMKQPDLIGSVEVANGGVVLKHPGGRPRKESDFSRVTEWRRRQEGRQAVLTL